MQISQSLLKDFAKVLTPVESSTAEHNLYGTAHVSSEGEITVTLDGSDISTPVETLADVKEGDRVIVSIKDHVITIEGNATSPAARVDDLSETKNDVTVIQNGVANAIEITSYIELGADEDDKPFILLGVKDSDLKLKITNDSISFVEGTDTPTYMHQHELVTDDITVNRNLTQGHYIWAERSNGHYGLSYKE